MSNSKTPQGRIVKASPLLQQKIGSGKVPEKAIKRGQRAIDKNEADFKPMAEATFEQFTAIIVIARQNEGKAASTLKEDLIAPVMALKANAGMFGYPLVSRLAGTMLAFLETVSEVDEDVINIAEAHVKTLKMLVSHDIRDANGDYGSELETELKDVCRRYFAKKASSRKTSKDEPFFID